MTRGGETVGGRSIMGLMMLSAGPGTTIWFRRRVRRRKPRSTAITELVDSKFNEEGT